MDVNNKLSNRIGLLTVFLLFSFINVEAQDWFNDDWDYRKSIIIDSDLVEGNVTNFPILISVTDSDLADEARTDGFDIVFTTDNGTTQLDHEIQSFDNVTGDLIVWVKTDLSSSTDTEIFIYYGNSFSPNQQNVAGTWSSNFLGVWHKEGTSGSLGDNINYQGATDVAGLIGRARQYDGGADYAEITTFDETVNQATFTAWVNTNSFDACDGMIFSRSGGNVTGVNLGACGSGGVIGYHWNDEATTYNWTGGPQLQTNEWIYVAVAVGNSATNAYVFSESNGVDTGNLAFSPAATTINQLEFGRDPSGGRYFGGIIDEPRISNVVRSQAWLQTEFNNQINPDNFFEYSSTAETQSAKTTYYTYQNGNWNNASTWTTDPSGTLIIDPAVPGSEDRAVVLNGRTVTLSGNVTTSDLSVQINLGGILNMNGYEFIQTLELFEGRGTLRIQDSYYPDADVDNFAGQDGGIYEITGNSDVTIPSNLMSVKNLRVNTSSSMEVITLLDDFEVYENLTINRGTFRVNDNSSNTAYTLTIGGNIMIESQGLFRVGTANQRHQIELYGDLINNSGSAWFTNQGSPNYNADPTQGTVDIHMLGESNTEIVANGEVRFNRLIINKGFDQTFEVTARSNNPSNFAFYGRIDQTNGSTSGEFSPQNPEVRKALWVRNGTLILRNQIDIPRLSEGGDDFFIPENAKIVIDGAEVASTSTSGGPAYTGLTIYGELRMISGVWRGNKSAGIVYRNSGAMIIEGGSVIVSQIRQSGIGEGSNFTSYVQLGGTVQVDGSGQNSGARSRFSMNQPENIFRMEGGVLRVQQGTGTGGIEILSSPENFNVTGGTVEVVPQNGNNPFIINSTAPLYNLVVQNGNRNVRLDNDLRVLNNFTNDNLSQNFDLNGNDLDIGRNFTLADGANFLALNSKLGFFGIQNSELLVQSESYVLEVGEFEVDKSNSFVEVVFASPRADGWNESTDTWAQPNEVLMIVNGELRHLRGLLDNFDFTIDVTGDVTIGDRIGRDDVSRGRVQFIGSAPQNIVVPTGAPDAVINYMQIYNSDGVSLSGGDMSVQNGLLMREGIFNIGSRKLSLLFPQEVWIWADPFGSDLMIRTNGNNSDGGVAKYFDGNQSHFIPIGTGTKFTPVEIAVSNNASDNGIIQVNPVNQELATLASVPSDGALQYFWRVRHSDFGSVPTAQFDFHYLDTDVEAGDDAEEDYVVGRVVGDDRQAFGTPGQYILDNVLSFPSGTLTEGAYTAAVLSRFTGDVTVYYTRRLGDGATQAWTDGNLWTLATNNSYDPHDSRQPAAGSSPGPGDIAIIGWVPYDDPEYEGGMPHGVAIDDEVEFAKIIFTQMLDESNNPTARNYFRNFQFRPTLVVNPGGVLSGDDIEGEGMFWLRSTGDDQVDPDFSSIDIGDFVSQDSSYVIYESTNDGFIYNNIPPEVPNLLIAGNNWGAADRDFTIATDVTVRGYFELLGDVNLMLNDGAQGDITVLGDLRMFRSNVDDNDSGGGAEIVFPNSGTRTIDISGNLELINDGATIYVGSPNAPASVHTLSVGGSLYQDNTSGGGLVFYTGAANDVINLEFKGDADQLFSRDSGAVPQLNAISVNKDAESSLEITTDFTLNGVANGAVKPLQLLGGAVILDSPGIDIIVNNGGANFQIISSAALDIRQGRVQVLGEDTGLLLDGLLRLSNTGEMIIEDTGENNYIEYSGSGNAIIDVSDSSVLVVGSQVRRQLLSGGGNLKFRQSGGSVTVGTQQAPNNIRGVFEVVNPGSEFSFTGGTFTIVRGHDAASSPIASLFIEPASHNLAPGSIIQIGNDDTPVDEIIEITSSIPLRNLIVDSGTLRLRVRPLTLQEDLTISTGTTFNSNSRNVLVAGDVQVDGSLISDSNTFTFNGSGAQVLALSDTQDFLNVDVNKSTGTLFLTGEHNISVNGNFRILNGTVSDGGSQININGFVTNNGVHQGSGRINFVGSDTQELSGNATAVFQNVRINNLNSVISNTDMRINGELTLQNGVLIIGDNLVTFSETSEISGSFNNNRMIRANGALSDKGIRKEFVAGNSPEFIFPIGSENKFRPVSFNINATSEPGSITIKPINIAHPSLTGDGNHRLKYYWIVGANGFDTDLQVTHSYTYDDIDIIGDDEDFIVGRFIGGAWSQFDNTTTPAGNVNTTSNTFTITNTNFIAGDYSAAESDEFGELLVYYSFTDTGDWTDAGSWVLNEPNGPPASNPPFGNPIVIMLDHTITIPDGQNGRFAGGIVINGTLDLGATNGHVFGEVSGNGTMLIKTDDVIFPAGDLSEFIGPDGGVIEYEFAGEMTLPTQATYNSLRLSGNSIKRVPSGSNIEVLQNLIIEEGQLDLQNRQVSIGGDFSNNTTSDDALISGSSGSIRMVGSQAQTIGGNADFRFCNLIIENDEDVTLENDTYIDCQLQMISGQLQANGSNVILDSDNSVIVNEAEERKILGTVILTDRNVGFTSSNLGNIGLSISSGSDNIGNVSVTRVNEDRTVYGAQSINKVWIVTSTNPPSNGRNVTLSWFESEDNDVSLSDTGVFRNSGDTWVGLGGSRTGRSITANTNTFSEWTVVDESTLPIVLENFEIKPGKDFPSLEWSTASEYENYGFNIERNYIGMENSELTNNWEELAFIEGMGTKRERTEYEWIDQNIEKAGYYQYRLTQLDYDGQYETYDPIEFYFEAPVEFKLFSNYPNPFNPITSIPFHIAQETQVDIIVYDILGRRVQILMSDKVQPGRYTVQFNGARFASGVYLVRLVADGNQHVKKMMLIK